MTLAAILLVGMVSASGTPVAGGAPHLTALQASSATDQTDPAKSQNQDTTPPVQNSQPPSQAQPPTKTPSQTSSTHGSTTAKRPHQKKKVSSSDCTAIPAAAQNSAPTSSPSTESTASTGSATPPANCPPSKVIVRQGGTSEPSIQLAGGTTGSQTSTQRNTANQMLETTDANLKKIAGRQLNSNEQDIVSQIRQFMSQSKTAAGQGDMERARTLAWKAQLLSEDLVKPEK